MKITIIRYLLFPFLLVSIFGCLSIVNVINLFIERDIYINSKNYKKTIAKFNNIEFNYAGDMDQISFYGFGLVNSNDSFYVDFDHRGNQYYYEQSKLPNPALGKEDYNDTKYHYIWYRAGYDKAFPALPHEKEFPVWQRLHKELKLTYVWLFSLAMTILIWKTGVKMGFMNKKNIEDET